jgi:hypothetical protein
MRETCHLSWQEISNKDDARNSNASKNQKIYRQLLIARSPKSASRPHVGFGGLMTNNYIYNLVLRVL